MATTEENMQVVQRFWDALAARDWDGMAALLTDDAHYTDVGTPGPGGTGPDGVLRRLRIGIELSLLQDRDETLSGQVNDSLRARVFSVESIAGVTATSGSARSVNFDTQNLDLTGGDVEWSSTSDPHLVTVQTEGVWRVEGGVHWAALATGVRWGGIRLNGSTTICGSGPVAGHASTTPRNNMSRTLELEAGAELDLRCYQDSGNNRTATGFLTLEYVGTVT